MSRPRNNLEELNRKHCQPAPGPPLPATPQAGGSKSKFKPAKAVTSSAPPNAPLGKLPSFSTPNYGKAKPPALHHPSTFDNSLSYVNISSGESTPRVGAASSVPTKRLSTGAPDDLQSRTSPKRPKTVHSENKENSRRDKGKARAYDPPFPPLPQRLPALNFPSNTASTMTHAANTLRAVFEALPHAAGLGEKTEDELRATSKTAQELIDTCNKLYGVSRSGDGDMHDNEFLDVLTEYLEKRLSASRKEIKAIQRGEPRTAPLPPSSNLCLPTGYSTTLTDDGYSSEAGLANTSGLQGALPPHDEVEAAPPDAAPPTDDEEEYWRGFPEPDESMNAVEVSFFHPATPATPPATQPRSFPNPPSTSFAPFEEPVEEPIPITRREYYPLVHKTLKEVFKLSAFRPQQLAAISAAMEGRDVLVLFPTGSGKSLTFQLPAVCQEGVTVVVSPLLALMHDQVHSLRKLGIAADQMSGNLTDATRAEVRQRLWSRDKPKLLYVTPEQLQKSGWMKSTLDRLYGDGQLQRFVVDEAHCITDWGRRFRDSYPELRELRKSYPKVPISALTATAPPEAESDLVASLGMESCARFQISSNRPNLDYEVRNSKYTPAELAAYIRENHADQTGIIYSLRRQSCEEIALELREEHGLSAKHYHAGLDPAEKEQVQNEWYTGETLIVVATVAFGMGIDKANVRFVIHCTLPGSLQNYYQETGRAGRDGLPAKCLMYYQYSDFAKRVGMIRRDECSEEQKQWQIEEFTNVQRYSDNNATCRRQQVLQYFKQAFDPKDCKDLCDNCRNKKQHTTVDYTEQALIVIEYLEHAAKANHSLTSQHLREALRGSQNKTVKSHNLDKNPCYGALQALKSAVVDRIVQHLIHEEVIDRAPQTRGRYTHMYLSIGGRAADVKNGQLKVNIAFLDCPDTQTTRSRKPSRKAASHSTSVAGPSTLSRSTSRQAGKQVEAEPIKNIPLFSGDSDEDPDYEEDDIEDVSSPPPRTERKPSKTMWDSDIEEVDSPPPRPTTSRVTLVHEEDIEDFDELAQAEGPSDDVMVQCRADLLILRKRIQDENPHLAELFNDEVIELITLMPPREHDDLHALFKDADIELRHFVAYERTILDICTKYAE